MKFTVFDNKNLKSLQTPLIAFGFIAIIYAYIIISILGWSENQHIVKLIKTKKFEPIMSNLIMRC